MLFVWQMMQAMELKVKLPMILQCYSKGIIDLSNNWSTGDRVHHVDVQMYMLQDPNEQKLIQMEWIDGNENPADLGTKNLDATSHKKHTIMLCDKDVKFHPISK